MKATEFKRVVLFMANRWDEQRAIEIFGSVMGEHFWNKWCGVNERNCSPNLATMILFYEMDEGYLQTLIDYVERFYCQGARHDQPDDPTIGAGEETGEE